MQTEPFYIGSRCAILIRRWSRAFCAPIGSPSRNSKGEGKKKGVGDKNIFISVKDAIFNEVFVEEGSLLFLSTVLRSRMGRARESGPQVGR